MSKIEEIKRATLQESAKKDSKNRGGSMQQCAWGETRVAGQNQEMGTTAGSEEDIARDC